MKHLMILIALVLVTSMSFAQISGDFDFVADVTAAGGPLTVAVANGAGWTTLLPGQSYKCVTDNVITNTNITPFTNGETYTPGILDITGAPGASVVLNFYLPPKLYPAAAIGYITMSYDNWSASVIDMVAGIPSSFFNPQVPKTITLDAAGAGQVWFGGNPTVSADAVDGEVYTGYGIVTGEYTGM